MQSNNESEPIKSEPSILFFVKLFIRWLRKYYAFRPGRAPEKSKFGTLLFTLISTMQKADPEILYDPNQIFPLPYTLISNGKKSLTSVPLKQPFAYQVYCPISCKKIKIGASKKPTQLQLMEFNTTTCRNVSVFVDGAIKYLVNGHPPNKKDKRTATGDDWSIHLEVQDNKNIAILNPFYFDPQNPISFYVTYSLNQTFKKIGKVFEPEKSINFEEAQWPKHDKEYRINGQTVYMLKSQKGTFVSLNRDFDDCTDEKVTIHDPRNWSRVCRVMPEDLKPIVQSHLDFWLGELNQIHLIEKTGKSETEVRHNLDEVYESLSYFLSIDEQLRFRLLSSQSAKKELLGRLFDYHPRAYSCVSRLASFLNYGDTQYSVEQLARVGFYNKTDMLQDLAFVEAPQILIPTAEENHQHTQPSPEKTLRSQLFPFSRLHRDLPFPEVSIETFQHSLSPQKVTSAEVTFSEETPDGHLVLLTSDKKLSVWKVGLALVKLFEIDLEKPHQCQAGSHKVLRGDKEAIGENAIQAYGESSELNELDVGNIFEALENSAKPQGSVEKPQKTDVPDQGMLDQLINMGYPLDSAKQALLAVENESVAAALDEIETIEKNKKEKKNKNKPKSDWQCVACTFINPKNAGACEVCATEAPEVVDEAELEKERKQEEERKKKEEEKEQQIKKEQEQKAEKEKQLKEQLANKQKANLERLQFFKSSRIESVKLIEDETSGINPFLIVVVYENEQLNRSMLKMFRVGYNRLFLAQFYRYEQNGFISNLTKKIHKTDGESISCINELYRDCSARIQGINRLLHPYRPNEYFVCQEQQISEEGLAKGLKVDGRDCRLVSFEVGGKTKSFQITTSDSLSESKFELVHIEVKVVPEQLSVKAETKVRATQHSEFKSVRQFEDGKFQVEVQKNSSHVCIEVVEHLPAGSWKPCAQFKNNFEAQVKGEGEVSMSEFLPLTVENYEGSVFSSKYHSTALLERSSMYISNYPTANFAFKSISSQPMLIESATVVSSNKRLQKIFPVSTGLIFTADELCWFELAKRRFHGMKREHYEQWLGSKKDRTGHREFWEPVAFFEVDAQVEVELDYKRTAKYVFLLPTGCKVPTEKTEVAALKLEFFGVKGQIETEVRQAPAAHSYKNDTSTDCELELANPRNCVTTRKTGVNSFAYIPEHLEGLSSIPTSVSTFFEVKLLRPQQNNLVSIKSKFLKSVRYYRRPLLQKETQVLSLESIGNFETVLEQFDKLTESELLQVIPKLDYRELLLLLIANNRSFKNIQTILALILENDIERRRLFEKLIELLPQLCEEEVKVSEHGLKVFLRQFEKLCSLDSGQTFRSLEQAWQNCTEYVSRVRNKNYNILRNKYEICELVLEPSLFSKDYYRLIHPSYTESGAPAQGSMTQFPDTPLNSRQYTEKSANGCLFRTYIDLNATKVVKKVSLYFPKLSQPANHKYKFNLKLYRLKGESKEELLYSQDASKEELLYSRHFNEEFLVQFAQNAHKDKEIFSQSRVNFFTIDLGKGVGARLLRVEYSYLLLTTVNSLRYKEPTESLELSTLVSCESSEASQSEALAVPEFLSAKFNSDYPSETKHSVYAESMPPKKYASSGNFIFSEVHEFPEESAEKAEQQFNELVDKISTNILDRQIVEESLKAVRISQYQLNQKGLDFAYVLMISLIKVHKKLPSDYRANTPLLLELFRVFVVLEIGPIMKTVFSFVQTNYGRLGEEGQSSFVSSIIDSFLSDYQQYASLKESEKYSISRILSSLGELDLPKGLLIGELRQAVSSANRFKASMLLKLLHPNISRFGVHSLAHYRRESQKFSLSEASGIVFKLNLWVLDHVGSVKAQMLEEGLKLLLILMKAPENSTEGLMGAESVSKANREMMELHVSEQEVWRLIFLTQKLKDPELNEKVHQVFSILISNPTERLSRSVNTMLLEIIKKEPNSLYSQICGEQISNELWMGHLQTLLEYLNTREDKKGGSKETEAQSGFFLDVETSLELLELPLTPVLWSLALLIIPREDRILTAIIKNFKQEYYSSVGKEITQFCVPLAGIRPIESIHINWLELVRKTRLEGRSMFALFLEQLQRSNFGGRQGLLMATLEDVRQLEITSEFLKLALEAELPEAELTESTLRQVFTWYFLNNTSEKGSSPATEHLRTISADVEKLIQSLPTREALVPKCIKIILEIKKQSEAAESMFEQKRIPTHSALTINNRFCKSFEELLSIFLTSDSLNSYFAFQLSGLNYLIEKLNLAHRVEKQESKPSGEHASKTGASHCSEEEEFLMSDKIFEGRKEQSSAADQEVEIKCVEDLKEEEFANYVKLVPGANPGVTSTAVDWTLYKKGNKTKIAFLPMVDPAVYHEFPLYVELGRAVEVRSIKIGFPSASYEFADKVVLSPSSVVVEGSLDGKSYQPLGEMTFINDDGYLCNGVKAYVLNLQKTSCSDIDIAETLSKLSMHRVKFLKIVVKRPLVTFIEGQYSQLNTKPFKNLGCSISMLSVTGDDVNKLPPQLCDSCREISKRTSLNLLSSLLTEGNSETMRRVANDGCFAESIRHNFPRVKELIASYKETVSQIVESVGSSNEALGDWLIDSFVRAGREETYAKIVNRIVVSCPARIHQRLDFLQGQLFKQLSAVRSESEAESSLIYNSCLPFMESFCQTLEQSYELLDNSADSAAMELHCSREDVECMVDILDRKSSSPEIKALMKLLISLVWIRRPLRLVDEVVEQTLDLVWKNCSEDKPFFYVLSSALLVSKQALAWVQQDDHRKARKLIGEVRESISKDHDKALVSQMSMLSILSYHESQFFRSIGLHLDLYNALKARTFASSDVFDSLLKILQNSVLGSRQHEQEMARLLIEDVELLVRRKDPILQKFYVGVLGLELEVMIHLRGVDLKSLPSTKKAETVPSKLLSKQQQRSVTERIAKKLKYVCTHSLDGKLSHEDFYLFAPLLYTGSSLIVVSFKLNAKTFCCGIYCSTKPIHSEEDDYMVEDEVLSDKSSFVFILSESHGEFLSSQPGDKILSVYDCQDEDTSLVTFYGSGGRELFKLNPMHNSFQLNRAHFLNGELSAAPGNPQLLGVELFECKPVSSGLSGTKVTELLTKSNQARSPFTMYRHDPIYIFPAHITLAKFSKLLSSNVKVGKQGREQQQQTSLGALSQDTSDFILDVKVEKSEEFEEQEEFGYIPTMKVFDCFNQSGGINKVLQLGSLSIRDWKNETRKKNFEHYMEELKSFIDLPNFFSLFIKNHKYVTFLFEVASGMPDDPNSTRNWEEEEVNSSRFIYKILSDIFRFDRSRELRNMDRYEDFCEIILEKLSEISKEAPRVYQEVQSESQEEELEPAQVLEKKKTEEKKLKKKKGTGYGADNQNNSKWSSAEWLENKKIRNQEIERVVSIFVSFLDCESPITDERLSAVIKESCLLPLVESALRSGSLLDISKEADLFKNYLAIIRNLAKNPATVGCLVELEKNYKPEQTESIYSLLKKLSDISAIFLDCLKSGKETADNSNQHTLEIANDIQRTFASIDRAVRTMMKNRNVMTIREVNQLPIAKAYRLLLESLRFGYVDLKKGALYEHAYNSTISSVTPSTQKILRLSQELADLSSSLPCEHTNSIFVRCDKSRIDVVKILIMGSKDTPYSNGAFMFDLYCDDTYPNNPPKMLITTTGSGKIRFNPNLYSCGKVCLSLLGTWRGLASENWDPKLSTLLQLFISTQGITMSEDIYFNEPGFDGEQGTEEGEKKNEAYSNIVKLGNVRYAMNEQIRNPPKGFEDVINRHFYVKKHQILQECEKWLKQAAERPASYTGLVSDHNSSWCSELKATKTKYRQLLEKEVNTLRELLDKLPEPDLKEKDEEEEQLVVKSHKKKRHAQEAEVDIDVAYDTAEKQELKIEEDVMQDRWSRYIGAMGIEAVKKQSSSSVLLLGLGTLGLQVAKNLVLSGLQKLTIVEDRALTAGSEEHFYMSDLKGQSMAECIFKIKELNPYMLVDHAKKVPESLKGYSLVVSTLSISESLPISEACRKENIKFVYTQTCGVSGCFFSDFGSQFSINDPNGEEPFEGLIESITCDKEGVVKLLDGVRHPYEDGDYVFFSKVQGMQVIKETMEEPSEAQQLFDQMTTSQKSSSETQSINGKVFKVEVVNWNSFKIGDTTNFKPYVRNGIVKNIKIPKKVQYASFVDSLTDFENKVDPSMGIYDFEKIAENFAIFASFRALGKFEKSSKGSARPRNWNEEDAKTFAEMVAEICKEYKKTEDETSNVLKFAENFSFVSEAELPAISAYLGGLVSQEVIKGLTNKYTPIKQFFTFHLNQMMQKAPEEKEKLSGLQVKDEEFRNIKIVVGRHNMKKIEEMKLFIVGAGAIGCELLKNFAMANMGAEGKITVTDPDHIETSNLTRQFLFRQKHVKKPKSATASAVLVQMNPNLKNHISTRLDKVCEETEDIYSDEFFKSQTVIANALDNVKARQYMDKRCVKNKLPLFESGTLGPKGHVQVIVPFKTENYGSQNDPNEEAQIPHCTLKMFPEEITHCIEWSRDIFGKVFTLNPKALKKIIDTKDDGSSLQGKEKATILKMVKYHPKTFDDCIAEAVRVFYKYFRNDIRQLLHTYPLDMKTKDGKLFWSLPKRTPKQISEIDPKDEAHQTFIASYSALFAKVFNIDRPQDFRKSEGKQRIIEKAIKIKVEDFKPSEEKAKELQELTQKQENGKPASEPLPQEESQTASETVSESENEKIPPSHLSEISLSPEEFQKDEDSNGHIDLIYSMSNLRARNYDLGECKWIEAKLKAGRIMAALSTTTSVVAALQTLEIIKLVCGSEIYRNAFVNLAVPLVQITEPGPALKEKVGNSEFSVWEDWHFKAESLRDLLTQIREKYDVEGFNVSTAEGKPIFWEAMYKGKEEAQETLLSKNLSQVIGKDKTELNVLMRDFKGEKIYEKVPRVIVEASK